MPSYLLDSARYKGLKTRGKVLICRICGKPLKVGERVVHDGSWKKYYHAKCFESLLI